METQKLMIPGPVELSERVLSQLGAQVVRHYGGEWVDYYWETVELLKDVFRTKNDVLVITGSGTSAIEAAIGATAACRRRKLLVLTNGLFGDRMAAIARSYSNSIIVDAQNPACPLDPARLRLLLRQHPDIGCVGAVHCETVSGILNPIEYLGAECAQRDVLFAVDAVSTLGGVEIAVDSWHIDMCATASQKCLSAPPGLGILSVSKRAWQYLEDSRIPGWYLSLSTWRDATQAPPPAKPYPTTLATPVFRALRRALEELLSEGLVNRFHRHASAAQEIRRTMQDLGFELNAEHSSASPTVTVVRGSPLHEVDDVVESLRRSFDFIVAGGAGSLTGQVFRIGHMGDVQTRQCRIREFLQAMRELCSYPAESSRYLTGPVIPDLADKRGEQ